MRRLRIVIFFACAVFSRMAWCQPELVEMFSAEVPEGCSLTNEGGKEGEVLFSLSCVDGERYAHIMGEVIWGGEIKALYGEYEVLEVSSDFELYRQEAIDTLAINRGERWTWVKRGTKYTVVVWVPVSMSRVMSTVRHFMVSVNVF